MRLDEWLKLRHQTHSGMSFASGCTALLALALLCSGCGAAEGTPSTSSTANSSRPTATPSPTPDPIKVDTQIVQRLAAENCDFTAQSVQGSYYPHDNNSVAVNVTFGGQWDLSTMQSDVKILVFNCFKAFFTSPQAAFVQDVLVVIIGPLTDAYGNTYPDAAYAHADLSRQTVSKFNWDNLFPETAWNNQIYDDQWVRTS